MANKIWGSNNSIQDIKGIIQEKAAPKARLTIKPSQSRKK